MSFIPASDSVVAFQSNSSVLQTLAGLMSTNASVITVGTAVANQSVSGAVSISNTPTFLQLAGSILATSATVTPAANQSVSGTVHIDNFSSVVSYQLAGSVLATTAVAPANQSVSGAVSVSNLPANQSVSGAVSVSNFPTNQNVSGSVVAFQGAGWSGSIAAIRTGQSGTLMTSVTGVVSVIGTVPVTQSGTWSPSVLSQYYRNDTLASVLGADGTPGTVTRDSQGRTINKPFVSNDGTLIEYTGSIVSGSVQLIQASVIGKRSYVTDILAVNTGATTTLLTLQDGAGTVLGYTVVPTGGGSNIQGLNLPFRTAVSQDLAFKVSPASSIVYLTLRGYQAQ